MMNIKYVRLYMDSNKDYVNSILINNGLILQLKDEIYLGTKFSHTWICECGNEFVRTWSKIKSRNRFKCLKCSKGIRKEYENIKDVILEKYTSRENINKLICKWLTLDDDIFINMKHKHNWRCKCGSIMKNKSFYSIKKFNSFKCDECKVKDKFSENIEYDDINKITLYKGLHRKEINTVIKKWLILKDDVYFGNQYSHTWECKCGEEFKRTWMDIKADRQCSCDKCRYNIKEEYNNISEVYIRKGMSREEVNKVINKWSTLEDEVYLGSTHNHKWKCDCGEVFVRIWSNIKRKNQIKCISCLYKEIEEKYKSEVEKDGNYEYVRAYFKGDILPNGNIVDNTPYIEVKHLYCENSYITLTSSFLNNKNRCGKCCGNYDNSLWHNHNNIAKMIVSDEFGNTINTKLIASMSHKKVVIRCDKCGKISSKHKSLDSIVQHGYSCEYCSDGISIPEKFMANILKQLGIKYVSQKLFKWSNINYSNIKLNGKKRYDFYILSLNMIIETHGRQHYEENTLTSRTLKEEQENDRIKNELALNNGIEHYIEIDCRYSTLNFLRYNMIKSLSQYFDLSNMDWNLAWEDSQNSLCVKAWELWNSAKTIQEIAKELNMSEDAIKIYVNRGIDIDKIKKLGD